MDSLFPSLQANSGKRKNTYIPEARFNKHIVTGTYNSSCEQEQLTCQQKLGISLNT